MKNKFIVFLIVSILLITSYVNKDCVNMPTNGNDEVILKKETLHDTKYVNILNKDKSIFSLDLENYVIGVVACEMPASFDIEALKAMAVSARTYVLYKMNEKNNYDVTTTASTQCFLTEDEMKSKWKDGYDKYYNKIKGAVVDTQNEYMTYNDKVILSFYFSISNGYTESCENVFNQKLDYLVSVDSSWDNDYSYKESDVVFDLDDFIKKIEFNDRDINNIEISRYDSGRVKEIIINNKKYSGAKFRTLLKLKSTDFEITKDNDKIFIHTKGYGHGVGMSQYGAEAMAKRGYSYDEILKYYYTGINIVNN